MMKFNTGLTVCFFALLLCACAGRHTAANPVSPDRQGAMNELQKGNGRYQQGCYREALEHFFKAHELFAASDHADGVAISMNNIGNVYRATGELESALLFYEEAFILYGNLQNRPGALQSLSNKAAALIAVEKFSEAEKEFARAEKIAGAPRFAPLLKNRGLLLFKKRDYRQAKDFLNSALQHTNPLQLSEFAAVNYALGCLMLETNRPAEAIAYFEKALAADRSASYYQGIADDLAALGAVYDSRGHTEEAVGFLKRAVKIYALIQNRPKVDATLNLLRRVSQKSGADSEVTEFFVKSWTRGDILERPCK